MDLRRSQAEWRYRVDQAETKPMDLRVIVVPPDARPVPAAAGTRVIVDAAGNGLE